VENYFNYFTEVEERFLRRRGGGLLLSTLDWALIETWKEAGVPLEAVLKGIDAAFDRYDERPSKTRKVNSLAYCAQEVLAAAEDIKEGTVGAGAEPTKESRIEGFEPNTISMFLVRNADLLDAAKFPARPGVSVETVARECASALRKLSQETEKTSLRLEDVERRLTVLEEKLFAALVAGAPDEEIAAMRKQVDHELSPYRRKMSTPQIDQLQKQYVHKRLLEKYSLPRLSLFYM
jgi:hypothetical protein